VVPGRGAEFIFPDQWEAYVAPIPASERHDMVAAYHRALTGDDVARRERAAAAWTRWEMATSSLQVKPEDVARCEGALTWQKGRGRRGAIAQTLTRVSFLCHVSADDGAFAAAFARIENHYFFHKGFFASETCARRGKGGGGPSLSARPGP
jgi:proline iminopeptidase